jgi:hypothetical protein
LRNKAKCHMVSSLNARSKRFCIVPRNSEFAGYCQAADEIAKGR